MYLLKTLIEFLTKLEIDHNTAATIVVTIIIFIIGGIAKLLSHIISSLHKRYLNKCIIYSFNNEYIFESKKYHKSCKITIKEFNENGKYYSTFVSDKSNLLNLMDYDLLFKNINSGLFNLILNFRSKRKKAFNKMISFYNDSDIIRNNYIKNIESFNKLLNDSMNINNISNKILFMDLIKNEIINDNLNNYHNNKLTKVDMLFYQIICVIYNRLENEVNSNTGNKLIIFNKYVNELIKLLKNINSNLINSNNLILNTKTLSRIDDMCIDCSINYNQYESYVKQFNWQLNYYLSYFKYSRKLITKCNKYLFPFSRHTI